MFKYIALVGIVFLCYFGVTIPDGAHVKVGFSESKGLHLLVN